MTALTPGHAAAHEGDAPLTHFFHCWRFPDHHACAVALIERQQEENDRLLFAAAAAARARRAAPAGQWTVAELAAALNSFYAWFTVVGGGARVQGQLLGTDVDEFARALHAGLESGRAHRR